MFTYSISTCLFKKCHIPLLLMNFKSIVRFCLLNYIFIGNIVAFPSVPKNLHTAQPKRVHTVEVRGNSYLSRAAIMTAATQEKPYQVYMKAYDLSRGIAAQISPTLLGFQLEGLWHTSIVIYGNEYLFGSGISYYPEKQCESITALPVSRRIYLGDTYVTPEVFHSYIDSLKETFSPESYNLLRWNCNHFTNAAAEFLTGKGIDDEYVHMVERIEQSPQGKILLSFIQQVTPEATNILQVPTGKQ
uniref:PPPDE domain-containing protein n=1 Tax=Babesia bovis TaxID=5865 RepID=S6BKM4_BABBO|nr:hypothetical protein [Babesia bovis]